MKKLHPVLLALLIGFALAAVMFIISLITSFRLYVNLGGVIGLVIMAVGGLFGGNFSRSGSTRFMGFMTNSYEERRQALGAGLFLIIVGAPLLVTSILVYFVVYG